VPDNKQSLAVPQMAMSNSKEGLSVSSATIDKSADDSGTQVLNMEHQQMISRLITDKFIRKFFQWLIVSGLSLLLTLQLLFLWFLLGRKAGVVSDVSKLESVTLQTLGFPFKKDFASFSVIAAGLLPMIFSAVCYTIDVGLQKPSDTFNRTGHVAVVLLMSGVFMGTIAIVAAGTFAPDVANMVGDPDENGPTRTALRNTLSAIVGFQTFYVAQLLGLKK
jgi:hypothetical protein